MSIINAATTPYRVDGELELVDGETLTRLEQENTALHAENKDLRRRLDALTTKHEKQHRRRSGSAARLNPDDIRLFGAMLAGNALYALLVLTASYGGLYGIAEYTGLPTYMWWIIPLVIDIPLVLASFNALIFRRRGESQTMSWMILIGATIISSSANFLKVYLAALDTGVEAGDWFGAGFMASVPVILLFAWEQLNRLGVKRPTVEERRQQGTLKRRPPKKGSKR